VKKSLLLNDLEQIKALADPLRMRLFKAFSREALTTKQVADLLEEPPTKLYRHVQILEKLKLIKLVRTRTKRGIVEKYYQTVAKDIQVDSQLFASMPRDESLKAYYELLNGMLQTTLNEISRNLEIKQDHPEKNLHIKLIREEIRTTPEKIETLRDQLDTWIKDFEAADQDDGEVDYHLTLVLYPREPLDKKESPEEDE